MPSSKQRATVAGVRPRVICVPGSKRMSIRTAAPEAETGDVADAAPQADAYAAYPQVPNAYVAESTYQAPLTNGASMQPMPAMSPHDAESYSQPTPSATYAPVARSEPMVTQPQSATGAAPSLSPSVYQAPFAQAAYQAPPPSYLQQNAPSGYVLPPPSHTGASVIAPPSPRYPPM